MLDFANVEGRLASMANLARQIREIRENLSKLESTLADHLYQMEDQFRHKLDELAPLKELVREKLREAQSRREKEEQVHFGKSHE